MEAENLGRTDGERTIHVDRHLGDEPLFGELVEHINELLSPLDREGRDDDLAFLFESAVQNVAEKIVRLGGEFVLPVSVSALHEEDIDILGHRWIPEKLIVAASHIAGKEEALATAVLHDVEDNLGRAENVSGVDEGEGDPVRDRD